ncbi:MAG TPA: AsmA family protein [Burkholderiales bacterium]|jgi:uncharacterized protein involved in outer membrane biogenesis|nr:AsmA family protein [Burkholderiales bacterium]
MSSPANPESGPSAAPSKRRGVLRILLWTLASLLALLVLLVLLFLLGIPVPGDPARSPLEELLSKVFHAPTRIEGPLRLRTGLVASVEAEELIVADPLNPGAPPLARAMRARVRIDLRALLRRAVKLDEITVERADINLERAADGRGNWEPLLARSGGPGAVQFAGIGRLQISALQGSYGAKPGAEPVRWELKGFDSSLMARNPMTARGELSLAGRTLAFDASSASLTELLEGNNKPIPLKATVEAAGARMELSGNYAPATAVLETAIHITGNDADGLLAALGVKAREAGSLDVRGEVRVDAREAAINKLALQLGKTSVSGGVRVNWAGARPLIALDLTAQLIDETPFLAAAGPASDKAPMVGMAEGIHEVATRIDLDAKISVAEFIGMAAGWRAARVESRIDDRLLVLHASGDVLGMKAKAVLDYSARDPKRTLTWHLEGGRFSTEKLPGGARPGEVAGTLGGLRGELRAAGVDAQELVKSARLNLEARDLRFSWSRPGERPQDLHLTSARVDIASGRSARAQVHGRLGGRPCSLNVSGGTLQSLIAGERWPLTLDASCRGAKLASRGHVIVKGRETTAVIKFEGSANPIGPLGGALGLATDVPHDFAMSGELALTEALVDVKLERVRLGRTAGGGTASLARDGKGPHRVELAFKTVDIAELATLAPNGEKKAAVDLLARDVLPAKVHLPDLDLELKAATVRYGTQAFQRVHLNAAPREGHLRNARFAFQSRGADVEGEASADLRSTRPAIELSGTVKGADLGAALAHAGEKSLALRAGTIKARARAVGVKLGELLGSAVADVDVERARLANVKQFIPGLTGDAEFSAKLAVAEGQPLKLSANGSAAKQSFDLTVETAPLSQLAQATDRFPATLRASLGETRLEASGKLTLEGMGNLRLTLSGERLDRLGHLIAARLPEVGPYSFGASLAVAPDSIRASDLDVKFGKSRVHGMVSVKRGGERLAHAAELRAPVLHLEDLGLHLFVGEKDKSKDLGASRKAGEAGDAKQIPEIQTLLRAFDAKATLSVEALYSEGKHHASLQTTVLLEGGNLKVAIEDVQLAGGKARAELDLDARGSRPRLYLHLRAGEFEFGKLAEALKPKTPLEGTLDLLVDLSLEGLQKPLLGNANGHVDIAVFPRGLDIGAADNWGTGLLHMMQRTVDGSSDSRLNCAVGIFDVKNGVARSEAFFADTTRVRIIGELEADFTSGKLSGRMSPNAKNPRLLTVSPSVGIGGTMESPKVQLTPDSLITAPLRLIFPIHAFAYDWLNATGVPADGSAGCREAFAKAREVDAKESPPPSGSSRRFWPF